MDLNNIFDLANEHRTEHNCSAYPYENFFKLFDLVAQCKPKNILEIGTGIGFSAVVMAFAEPSANIDTIEKDAQHALLARQLIEKLQLHFRIKVYHDIAEILLPELQNQYDFIFFDGFQIHYEFLPQYERLLKLDGILVLANTHLNSKTSEQFFEQLRSPSSWQLLERFDDTMVLRKI